MFKNYFFLGIATGIVASGGSIAYSSFYNHELFDFSLVVGPVMIVATCLFVAVAASVVAWVFDKVLKSWGEFVFNSFFAVVSMASIMLPIKFEIPPALLTQLHESTFEGVEMFFPIFAIPMHFFPVLSWFALKPLFFRKR
jgi:tellurite resistance protein TehA-like permease